MNWVDNIGDIATSCIHVPIYIGCGLGTSTNSKIVIHIVIFRVSQSQSVISPLVWVIVGWSPEENIIKTGPDMSVITCSKLSHKQGLSFFASLCLPPPYALLQQSFACRLVMNIQYFQKISFFVISLRLDGIKDFLYDQVSITLHYFVFGLGFI